MCCGHFRPVCFGERERVGVLALWQPSFHFTPSSYVPFISQSMCTRIYSVHPMGWFNNIHTETPSPSTKTSAHTHTHPLAGREERLYTRYILISCENKCSSSRSGCFSFGLFPNFFFFFRSNEQILHCCYNRYMCTHILTFSAKCLYASAGGPLKELDDFYSTPLSIFNRNKQTGRGSNLAGPPQIKMFEKPKEQRYTIHPCSIQWRTCALVSPINWSKMFYLTRRQDGVRQTDRSENVVVYMGREKQLCNSGCQHLNLKKEEKKKDGL